MKTKVKLLLSLLMLLLVMSYQVIAQTVNLKSEYETLIAVEKAFAKTSELMGTRYAFLTFLDNDAIVFNPLPTSGIEVYKNRSESNSSLLWGPNYAGISYSGDMGFTTGPWEYRSDRSDSNPAATGHYVTVWRKNESNIWKVAIDIGIQYPLSEYSFKDELETSIIESTGNGQIESNNDDHKISNMLETDLAMADLSARDGFKKAFEQYASEDVRLYRDSIIPLVGKQNSLKHLDKQKLIWESNKGEVSLVSDLGYSYGAGHYLKNQNSESIQEFVFFRIWKYIGNEWKIILDVLTEI